MSVPDVLAAGGIVSIYLLLLSLLCAALTEGVAMFLQARSIHVFIGIKNLLDVPKSTHLTEQLYTHGLIEGVSQHASDPAKPIGPPFYVSPANFSLALLDILSARGIIAGKYGELLKNAENAGDAYEAALRAAAHGTRNPELTGNVKKTKIFQEEARAALQIVADR
jgi:hypothetical protein